MAKKPLFRFAIEDEKGKNVWFEIKWDAKKKKKKAKSKAKSKK